MKVNETEVRVFYSDTDHGGVVYYANYLKWFEVGRTELLRQFGCDYANFEKQRLIAPIVEVHCNYKFPAQYNDIVIIKTNVDNIGNSSIKFNYEMINKENSKLLAEGYTVNVFIDMKTKKPVKIPDKLREALRD